MIPIRIIWTGCLKHRMLMGVSMDLFSIQFVPLKMSTNGYKTGPVPITDIQTPLRNCHIYMKDAQCAETNERSIFLFLSFLFFELWSILYLEFTESYKSFDLNNWPKMYFFFKTCAIFWNKCRTEFQISSFSGKVDFVPKIPRELRAYTRLCSLTVWELHSETITSDTR